jgi:1,4-dihydroxy-2-naphthoate octaprenyltransferase
MNAEQLSYHFTELKSTGYRWLIAFVRMARPLQLLAVVFVYILGLLISSDPVSGFDFKEILFGLLVLLTGAISIHLANEFSDFETDQITQRTLFSGGSGALPELGLDPKGALWLAYFWLMITGCLVFLGLIHSWLLISSCLLLAIGVLLGWAYSMPPCRIAWRGWGETLNAFLGGYLLPLYGSTVILGRIDLSVLVVSTPFALLTFNNLLATTYADRDADRAVGKFTLATRNNDVALRRIYITVAFVSFFFTLFIPISLMPLRVKWLSLLTGPALIWGWRRYTISKDPLPSVSAMSTLLAAQLLGFLLEQTF